MRDCRRPGQISSRRKEIGSRCRRRQGSQAQGRLCLQRFRCLSSLSEAVQNIGAEAMFARLGVKQDTSCISSTITSGKGMHQA